MPAAQSRVCGGVILGLALSFASVSLADEIHKNAFSGKSTAFVKGFDNVSAEEKVHELSNDRSRSLPTSERIKLNCAAGKNETNFAYYFYPTPAAPFNEDLSAELWVHSTKSNVQFLARIVFPKERNPKQLDEPLTTTVLLDSYKAPAGGWQKLILKRPMELLKTQQQALRLQYRKDVDVTDAYIDRLILNLYAGPGEIEVYLDNLEIGPVKAGSAPPPPVKNKEGIVTSKEKDIPRTERGILVDYERGKLLVGGKPIFPRFIRYSGTPLQVLRESGFNALSMPVDTPISVLEDAIDNYQFWIVPSLPPVSEAHPEKGGSALMARDADALVTAIRKFQSGDGVLFYDFGAVRSEDYKRVSRTAEAVRSADPKRPVGADVWDGFNKYSIPLQLIGTHRDPLMTTLELDKYSTWLNQRKILASGSKFHWTWIQTHMPDWQTKLLYDKQPGEGFTEPVGPQPEQIRLLTYMALAAGCKALGFWSDRFLANSHQGKDRLLQLALLNQEIEMLEPILLNLSGEIRWVTSSHPAVKVAILRTNSKGLLALPIWLGGGAQYTPPQGAMQGLTFTVPLVPDGAEPWEITPVRVQSLQAQAQHTPEGVQITLPEFDLTSAIVFTADTAPEGQVAQWQRHTRRVSRHAAWWACEMADEQLRKVCKTQERLDELAPHYPDAPKLLREAERFIASAKRERISNNDELAYFEALRALRPLRILMRAQWERAVKPLDYPAASPYAISFYTLPKHWELARTLRGSELAVNALTDGDFERAKVGDKRGVAVTTLPGWTVQDVALDEVLMEAAIVDSEEIQDPKQVRNSLTGFYKPTSAERRGEDPVLPVAPLGNSVLRLSVLPKPVTLQKDEKAPIEAQALERVFLCANTPAVRLQPGTWVRISAWIKTPYGVRASADGAMFYETSCGEAYALRLYGGGLWKQYHMYRKVPASGEIRARFAITGFGTMYIDDIRIEPIVIQDGKKPLSMK